MKIKVICKICNKDIYIKPSVIKKGNGKFCSKKCFGIYHSKNIKGENNPNWNDGKMKREELMKCLCLQGLSARKIAPEVGISPIRAWQILVGIGLQEKLRENKALITSKRAQGNKVWEGKSHSEYTKKKMSESAKKRYNENPDILKKKSEFMKNNSPMIGRKWSEEHKKKISETLKGRPSLNKGKIMSEDQKLKIKNSIPKGSKSNLWKGGLVNNKEYQLKRKKINWHKRKALKRQSNGSFTLKEWEIVKKQFNYTCPMCFKKEPEISLTIDHIIPLVQGGDNTIKNIQPLCKSCNCRKGTKIIHFQEAAA